MNTYDLITPDAQRSLEEFSQEFAAAFAASQVEQWAKDIGFYVPNRALKTTFPIPLSAAGYKEFKGDIKYRHLFAKSLSMTSRTWQDGVTEFAAVIEAPDFIGWTSQPEAVAASGQQLLNSIIAEELAANATSWTGQPFFSAGHPIDVVNAGAGTFDNDVTGADTAPTVENLQLAKGLFRKIKGANGLPLGLRMTHVLAPAAQEEQWRDLLERDMMIVAVGGGGVVVDNRHKGTITPIFSDELPDDTTWYPIAANKPGLHPWIVQDEGAPEEIIRDKTSEYYKTTLKVSIAWILRANGKLAMPHAMQRWAGEP